MTFKQRIINFLKDFKFSPRLKWGLVYPRNRTVDYIDRKERAEKRRKWEGK